MAAPERYQGAFMNTMLAGRPLGAVFWIGVTSARKTPTSTLPMDGWGNRHLSAANAAYSAPFQTGTAALRTFPQLVAAYLTILARACRQAR
jgi:hypothetical protein